jgi:hypothetical protein
VSERPRLTARRAAVTVAVAVSASVTAALSGKVATTLSGDRMAPWILGRAAGVSSYLLLVVLVALGLMLSHPWRTRLRRPSTAARVRVHVSLAAFTAAFTALHVVVLASDHYAGVGWRGALIPLASEYRPVPTTLGVIGLYAGLLAGATATLAGRLAAWIWWPIHKVAVVSLILVWVHGVLGGSDTRGLLWMYVGSAVAILALAASRYTARTPADRVADLIEPTSVVESLPRHRAQRVAR